MKRCSECIYASEAWNEGRFIKTLTCANEFSSHFDEPVRPQHSCDKHKEINNEYFNIMERA
jgi:hypothetical protein